jgi:vacuolar-type H+-ATPase subunit H
MPEQTVEMLQHLRDTVTQAKGVPMSASCMVNRSEVLSLIDGALSQLETDLADARWVVKQSEGAVTDASREAERILREARGEADRLVQDHELVVHARAQAVRIRNAAKDEAAAFSREVDAFIDSRLAEFEADLQRTESSILTLRRKLASRAELDGVVPEPLPPIGE